MTIKTYRYTFENNKINLGFIKKETVSMQRKFHGHDAILSFL